MYGEDWLRPPARPPDAFPLPSWQLPPVQEEEFGDDSESLGDDDREWGAVEEDEQDGSNGGGIHDDEEYVSNEEELWEDESDDSGQDRHPDGCHCYWDGSQEVCDCPSDRSKSPSTSE